ncbi:MAG: GAF domain-containing SpoIIE family protein phosphatase [Dissulfurispiraceae bacterium]|jgi:sigma-B regulation protein RsbU (phosphoserine phosphatase)
MEEQRLITIPETVLNGMERKVEDLKTLMEMSAIFSSTFNRDDLISLVMEKAKILMDAEACSLLFYDKETNSLEFKGAICEDGKTSDCLQKKGTLEIGQGIAGAVAKSLQPLFLEDVSNDSRFNQEADRFAGLPIKSLIAVPLIGRSGLIGVAEILNPRKKDYDPEIFQLLSRQFAIAIENSFFYEESVERERLKRELDIASALQKSFLPESSTFRKGELSISAMNISAEKVGGDLYDFFEQGEDKVGILIGDTSGKGIAAALYMARFISDFRYITQHMDPSDIILSRMNSLLSKSPRGMFLTCICMLVDIVTGGVHLSVAGHPPFLWITKGQLQVMSVEAGPPLGIIAAEYPATTISLERGDRLLLLTDGAFDAKDKVGQRLGFENLVRFIDAHQKETDLVNVITDYVDDFSKGAERSDDVTIVEVRWG